MGLSSSLANAKDVGDWIGATAHSLVSFRPDVRPVPLELRLNGFDVNHFGSRMLAMAKPAYNFVSAGCAGTASPGALDRFPGALDRFHRSTTIFESLSLLPRPRSWCSV